MLPQKNTNPDVKDKNRNMSVMTGWENNLVNDESSKTILRKMIKPKEYGINLFLVDEKRSTFYGLSYSNDAIYKFKYGQ